VVIYNEQITYMESKLKYIIFTTKISIQSISNILVDKSIHFYDSQKEIENYISNFASNNGIKKKYITIEYDIIPLEIFKQAETIINKFGFIKEKNLAIWFIIKNDLFEKLT
jgi:hypothetical protein